MARQISRIERFRGALLGLALGDAMGAPLAGMKGGHVRQVYGEIDGCPDAALAWKGRPQRWSLRGLYTSNTQQALVVADILARDGRCDPKALAGVFVEMADAEVEGLPLGSFRRAGKNFRQALEQMRSRRVGPLDCGGLSAGCGAAARAVPLGLFLADDLEALRRAAIENALVTHRDPRAVAAAVAVALAVAQAVAGAESAGTAPADKACVLAEQVRLAEQEMELRYGRHLIRPGDVAALHHVSDSLALLPRLLEEGDDTLAWDSIVHHANRCAPAGKITDPSQGFAPACLTTALYIALGGRSFPEAVAAALALGREARDLGAIVGGVVGARDGEEAIPEHWLSGLLNADQVRLRADNLARGEIDYALWRGIVEMESESTAQEEGERCQLAALWEKRGELVVKKPSSPKPIASAPEPLPADLGFAPPPDKWLRRQKDRDRSHQRRQDRRRKRVE